MLIRAAILLGVMVAQSYVPNPMFRPRVGWYQHADDNDPSLSCITLQNGTRVCALDAWLLSNVDYEDSY